MSLSSGIGSFPFVCIKNKIIAAEQKQQIQVAANRMAVAAAAWASKEHVDTIPFAPQAILQVIYGQHDVSFGEVLTVGATEYEPRLSWPVVNGKLYTMIMVDPDSPSRGKPSSRHYLHWGYVNISDPNRLANGIPLADGAYEGPAPAPKTGLHRHIFLVYAQKKEISGRNISQVKNGKRGGWDLKKFLNSHSEIDQKALVAANLFLSQNAQQ